MNIKTSIFNLQHLSHFCIEFYATNTIRSTVKVFVDYIVFKVLVKKMEVIVNDTYYPWYRGAIVYKIYIYPAPYMTYTGQIWFSVDNKCENIFIHMY